MAKKKSKKLQMQKRNIDEEARAKAQEARDSKSSPPPMMDRRAMERHTFNIGRHIRQREFDSVDDINAYMQGLMTGGGIPEDEPEDPVEAAQMIMYDAWEATGRDRVLLARKALEVSEDCADAYVLLAEEVARGLPEARKFYELGVKAGERALKDYFDDPNTVGRFWGMIETRPYMRAREGLAYTLLAMGKIEEAIGHLEDMLRLNPNDNQGVRDALLNVHMAAGNIDAAEALMARYEDDYGVHPVYNRALIAFKRQGDSEEARDLLEEAIQRNEYVADLLLGKTRPPAHAFDSYRIGSLEEASTYTGEARFFWLDDRAAMDWLRKHAPKMRKLK